MNSRKIREGVVVSDKMQKSIIVKEERSVLHPIYKKRMKRTKKYTAHDENEDAKIGDRVKISETRPMSKNKKWRLVEIIKKSV